MIIDDWIYFDCFARTAVLLKFLRKQLVTCETIMVGNGILLIVLFKNIWLAEKMNQPDLDLGQYNEEVMGVLVKTLESNAI